MDKLKEIIKCKYFTVSQLILKNIKKFNLSINEFLLLLFFINVDAELDIIKIKDLLNLTEEESIEAFDGLMSKGLIEVKVIKNNGKVSEEISLDNFYNKLLLDMPEVKKESDIFSKFESEFGRTLSPIEYENINSWLENGIEEETIKAALKEAILNGVYNLRYIDRILHDWARKNFKVSEEKEAVQVFNYNWLEDSDESK